MPTNVYALQHTTTSMVPQPWIDLGPGTRPSRLEPSSEPTRSRNPSVSSPSGASNAHHWKSTRQDMTGSFRSPVFHSRIGGLREGSKFCIDGTQN